MLAEIFLLRIEATARVTARDAAQYSRGTVREREGGEGAGYTEYPAWAIWKALRYFTNTLRRVP